MGLHMSAEQRIHLTKIERAERNLDNCKMMRDNFYNNIEEDLKYFSYCENENKKYRETLDDYLKILHNRNKWWIKEE